MQTFRPESHLLKLNVINQSDNSDKKKNANQMDYDLIVEDCEKEEEPKYTTMQELCEYYSNLSECEDSPSMRWVPKCTYWDDWDQDVIFHREDENLPDGWFLGT